MFEIIIFKLNLSFIFINFHLHYYKSKLFCFLPIVLSDKVMCSQCNKQGHSARDCHQMKSLITITKQNNCKEIDNGGIDLKTSCIINCCNCNDLINHDCKHKDDRYCK